MDHLLLVHIVKSLNHLTYPLFQNLEEEWEGGGGEGVEQHMARCGGVEGRGGAKWKCEKTRVEV